MTWRPRRRAAGASAVPRHLVGGAVRHRCARRLSNPGGAERGGAHCRRRGLAQRGYGPPHDRSRRRGVHPDRCRAYRRHLAGQARGRLRAAARVTYVNHTFTSHLALSASLQPYAGHPARSICEYPVELKSLAWEMTHEHITPDANGLITLPEAPGLGMTPDLEAAQRYLLDVEIAVGGKTLYRTPELVL